MTYKTIATTALCAMISLSATAETNTYQSDVSYQSIEVNTPVIAHQAQLTSVAAKTSWVPTTFTMTNIAETTLHQAQQIAASTQAAWVVSTYAAENTAKVTMPLQHQAQLVGLMTQYDWDTRTANLSN